MPDTGTRPASDGPRALGRRCPPPAGGTGRRRRRSPGARAGDVGGRRTRCCPTCGAHATSPTAHYADPLDLDALAAGGHVSKYHFIRRFADTYGEPPMRYLTRRRIERAQDLLRTANLTVTEVCMLVGYSSLGSFSSRFHDLVGESPTAYRNRWAAQGGPHIPGCFLFMRGIDRWPARRRDRQPGRSVGRPPVRTVDPMITNVSLATIWVDRPGLGQGLLHRQARVPGGDRRQHGRRLPLADRCPSRPSRARADAHDPRPAPRRGDGRRLPRHARQGRPRGRRPGDRRLPQDLRGAQGPNGVEFIQEPAERPYGVEAILRDDSGNWLVMVERKEFDPSSLEGWARPGASPLAGLSDGTHDLLRGPAVPVGVGEEHEPAPRELLDLGHLDAAGRQRVAGLLRRGRRPPAGPPPTRASSSTCPTPRAIEQADPAG